MTVSVGGCRGAGIGVASVGESEVVDAGEAGLVDDDAAKALGKILDEQADGDAVGLRAYAAVRRHECRKGTFLCGVRRGGRKFGAAFGEDEVIDGKLSGFKVAFEREALREHGLHPLVVDGVAGVVGEGIPAGGRVIDLDGDVPGGGGEPAGAACDLEVMQVEARLDGRGPGCRRR